MEEENATHAKRSGAYAAVSAMLSLIGLLGLFLGYFTGGSAAGYAIAGGAPILKGSLWGVTVEILRGSIRIPTVNAASGLAGVLPFALYCAVIALVGAIVLSLIFTIAALLVPKAAKVFAYLNGEALFFCYGALFLGNLALHRFAEIPTGELDVSVLLPMAAILGVLFFTVLLENPVKGLANFALLSLSAASIFALVLSSALASEVNRLTVAADFFGFSLLIFVAISLLNALISVLRLVVKRGYPFDTVRFILQFLSAVTVAVAYFIEGRNFFSEQPLAAVLVLLCGLGGIVFAAFCTAVFRKKRKKKEREFIPDPEDLEEEMQPT